MSADLRRAFPLGLVRRSGVLASLAPLRCGPALAGRIKHLNEHK